MIDQERDILSGFNKTSFIVFIYNYLGNGAGEFFLIFDALV